MTESYEIDDLRRKVEDSKMKLETEQKVCHIICLLQCLLLKQRQTQFEANQLSLNILAQSASCYRTPNTEG